MNLANTQTLVFPAAGQYIDQMTMVILPVDQVTEIETMAVYMDLLQIRLFNMIRNCANAQRVIKVFTDDTPMQINDQDHWLPMDWAKAIASSAILLDGLTFLTFEGKEAIVLPATTVVFQPETLALIAGTPLSEWLQFMATVCGLPGQYDYSGTSF